MKKRFWLFGLLAGCGWDGTTPAPYKQGLMWTGTSVLTSETRSFRLSERDGLVESVGLAGVGEDCSDAFTSLGTKTETGTMNQSYHYEVLGNTEMHHPQAPGRDRYEPIGVSVVSHHVESQGLYSSASTCVQVGGVPLGHCTTGGSAEDGDTWNETSENDYIENSRASLYGVAADEYLVQLTNLGSLWDPYDQGDIQTENQVEENGLDDNRNFVVLTRVNPKKGDTWVSENGMTLYRYEGTEGIDVGGKSMKADKVISFTATDFDPTAADLFATCFRLGYDNDTTTAPDAEDSSFIQWQQDNACDGDQFTYQQTGTEWWAGNILIKAETRRVEVIVTNSGFESEQDNEGSCLRSTSLSYSIDSELDWTWFIEYTAEVVTETYLVDSIEKAAAATAPAAEE